MRDVSKIEYAVFGAMVTLCTLALLASVGRIVYHWGWSRGFDDCAVIHEAVRHGHLPP